MTWRPWHVAWQDALYGADGFYRRPEGPAGHFATSVQGIPGAGPALAHALVRLMAEHGLSRLVDVGSGRGELLAAVHALSPRTHLLGVDVVPRPDGLPAPARWLVAAGGGVLPPELTGLTGALVLAHEWLDVVPCPVVQVERGAAGIRATRLIEVDGTGRQRSGAPVDAADLAWLRRHWPDAADTADIGTTRDAAWADLCARVDDGLVVAVDYGHLADDRPPGSTLVGYRRGRPTDPVPDGSTDLTAHVAVDTLAGAVLRRQRDVLAPHAPARPTHDLARSDPARYLAELGRRGAWDALTARGGLGDFWWAMRRVRAD